MSVREHVPSIGAQESEEEIEEAPHRVPALPKDIRPYYEGLLAAGATSPTNARPLEWLSKQLHESRNHTEDALHKLEGIGVAGHVTVGNETLWYTKK